MGSNAKKWTNEESLLLVELYKKNPVMWNPQHVHYYNQKMKRDVWKRIAQACGVPVHEVKRRIFSMVNILKGEFKKMESSDRQYESRWFAFEKLSFLRNREGRNLTKQFITDEEAETSEYSPTTKNLSEPRPKRSKRLPPPETEEEAQARMDFEEAMDILKFAATTACARSDEYSTFADHLAVKLKSYDNRTVAIATRHIDNVLFQADMGDFKNVARPIAVNSTSPAYQSSDSSCSFF